MFRYLFFQAHLYKPLIEKASTLDLHRLRALLAKGEVAFCRWHDDRRAPKPVDCPLQVLFPRRVRLFRHGRTCFVDPELDRLWRSFVKCWDLSGDSWLCRFMARRRLTKVLDEVLRDHYSENVAVKPCIQRERAFDLKTRVSISISADEVL